MKKEQKWLILLALIFACGCGTTAPTVSPTTLSSLTPHPTFTPVHLAATRQPTSTPATPPPTVSPMPSPTLLPLFPLNGYVMLFVRDGNLYFQNGANAPVEVTQVGKASYTYVLSNDNQKLVLYSPHSSDFFNDGYSINTDGTQERPLFPGGWPEKNLLWGTQLGVVEFIPGTQQLIFSTHLCEAYDNPISCVSSIYLSDTNNGEVKKLADLGFSGPLEHENFLVSPNGKMVAVMTTSSVDIVGMDGREIRYNILSYKPNTPEIIFPSLAWLPDSSGLIIGLPTTIFKSMAYDYVSASTIWRYLISSNIAVQIPFDPPPPLDTFQVSPDGKWIVYGALGYNPEVYLGNLANGHTQIFGEVNQGHFTWGPDSKHFIADSAGYVLGAIDTPILVPAMEFLSWVDGNHFLWAGVNNKLRMAEIEAGGLKIYDLGIDMDSESGLLIRPK